MICIYHSRDLDGWMSAAIVKLWHERLTKEKQETEAEQTNGSFADYPPLVLLGWDYGQPFPDIPRGEPVVMVDISFPMDKMLEVCKNAGWNLCWIDHHVSAIKEYNSFIGDGETFMSTKLDPLFAACELTWMHFFDGEKMSEIVRLLGRYDCFGHKGTDEEQKVLEFQFGARASLFDPDSCYMALRDWDENMEHSIQIAGYNIYNYLCVETEQKYARKFDIVLDGYKFGCVNDWRLNPINFDINYHNDGYDGFACFWYDNGQFNYSLYNDNGSVDCSVIAKNRGGGGHKGAAGFRSETIIK